jgi:YHS domain-containing protein
MTTIKLMRGLAAVVAALAAWLVLGTLRAAPTVTNTPATTATNQAAVKPIPYPLKTCPVSDEKLGEMGKPDVFVYQGQEIKFCCPDCKADFLKDPAKYLKKIKELAAKQKP